MKGISHQQDSSLEGVLLFYAMSCCQYQEKPANESLATHLRHTAVYVQPFLQIGKLFY
jgi:hypothetical protein